MDAGSFVIVSGQGNQPGILPVDGVLVNGKGASWLYVENRSPMAVGFGTGSTGSTSSTPWLTVPGLSVACIPIDPTTDVLWRQSMVPGIGNESSQEGVNGASANYAIGPRHVIWAMLDSGSPSCSPLYPLESCVVTGRTLAALGTSVAGQTHFVNPPTSLYGTAPLIALLDLAGVHTVPADIPAPTDICLVAMNVVLTSLGASSQATDLVATVIYDNGLQYIPSVPPAFNEASDVVVFGNTAAAGGAISAPSGIIPLGGADAVKWRNTGPSTAIGFRVTYWLGIPAPA